MRRARSRKVTLTHVLVRWRKKGGVDEAREWALGKVDFTEMAEEAGISTVDHISAFSVLEAFWNGNSLGGPQ